MVTVMETSNYSNYGYNPEFSFPMSLSEATNAMGRKMLTNVLPSLQRPTSNGFGRKNFAAPQDAPHAVFGGFIHFANGAVAHFQGGRHLYKFQANSNLEQ